MGRVRDILEVHTTTIGITMRELYFYFFGFLFGIITTLITGGLIWFVFL